MPMTFHGPSNSDFGGRTDGRADGRTDATKRGPWNDDQSRPAARHSAIVASIPRLGESRDGRKGGGSKRAEQAWLRGRSVSRSLLPFCILIPPPVMGCDQGGATLSLSHTRVTR